MYADHVCLYILVWNEVASLSLLSSQRSDVPSTEIKLMQEGVDKCLVS